MSIKDNVDPKHPLTNRDYFLDASGFLQSGVTVTGAVVTATPAGLTLGTPVVSSPNVKVRVGGGVTGVGYTLQFVLTLSSGETEVALIALPVSDTGE
jgi:hypothetical protein